MGEIIPFPVSETYLRTLGSYEHHVLKDFFDLRSGNGEIIPFQSPNIIPFPVQRIPFLVLQVPSAPKVLCWLNNKFGIFIYLKVYIFSFVY